MIVLVGFMGSGKSTVGPRLAARLGVPFYDSDREIVARAGMTIAEMFELEGEGAFRTLEREVAGELLQQPDGVLALGGGALGDPVTRAALEWATVVHLEVAFGEALRRAVGREPRPMLETHDPKELYDERAASYLRAADHHVDTTGRSVDEIVDELVGLLGRDTAKVPARRIPVTLLDDRYEIVVGRGLLDRIVELGAIPDGAERAVIVSHPELEKLSERVARALGERIEASVLEIPSGEGSKSLDRAKTMYDAAIARGLHRNDVLLSVGGGVVCDVTGFVASTFQRGIAVTHVATTLLAQVDAAIGGKTAVNLESGKNLVGTFHQPRLVVCDVETLSGLPDDELRSGLAEVVKHGLIADPGLLDLVAEQMPAVIARDPSILEEVVARAAGVKAAVVAADERETGRRAILNYGHTFGHAIEFATGLRHGDAVALGMMAAAYTAWELGMLDADAVDVHRRLLGTAGLPVTADIDLVTLEQFLERDKKFDTGVRFVLLQGIGKPTAGVAVPREVVERALKRLSG